MKKESRGLVLAQKNNITSIIDEHYGRICAHSFISLFVGGFYTYSLEKNSALYLISYEEIFNEPLEIASHDIFFLHHLFEITIQCVPLGSYVKDIFLFFAWLYDQEISFFTKKNKKYVIFRLLSYVDMWPTDPIKYSLLLRITQIPIDRINQETLDLIPDEILSDWINDDFFNQGLYKKLKTKLFLNL